MLYFVMQLILFFYEDYISNAAELICFWNITPLSKLAMCFLLVLCICMLS